MADDLLCAQGKKKEGTLDVGVVIFTLRAAPKIFGINPQSWAGKPIILSLSINRYR